MASCRMAVAAATAAVASVAVATESVRVSSWHVRVCAYLSAHAYLHMRVFASVSVRAWRPVSDALCMAAANLAK